MEEEQQEKPKKLELGTIFDWIVGVILLVGGFTFIGKSLPAALMLFVLGVFFIPLIREFIEDVISFKFSSSQMFILLIIGAFLIGVFVGDGETSIEVIDEQLSQNTVVQGTDLAGAATDVVEEVEPETTQVEAEETNEPEVIDLDKESPAEPEEEVIVEEVADVEESVPETVERNEVIVPSSYLYKLEKDGVTVFIETLNFEQQGGSFGQITEVKFTVVNKLGKTITPKLKLVVFEKGQSPETWAIKILDESLVGDAVADDEVYSHEGLAELTIPDASKEKTIKFQIFDEITAETYLTLTEKVTFLESTEDEE